MPPYAHAKVRLWMTEMVAVDGATIVETACPPSNAMHARQCCMRLASA